ncbi:MAG: RecQ family ATP-dependent DNA helicase [Prevotellaceae bacterium]|jgi:ATP-dependent DNA helicase RecQ|nr:RecQ family ATP-dependent DNA helicase [Prevotellaceae bacterium]
MNNSRYQDILKQYWGYDDFRPLQLDIIRSVSSGRDTLGLMPTGGGKSITFQVPAMAREGICLVVSPLIALMKDQVENLRAQGIKAAAIHSGMTATEMLTTFENCEYGDFKFLYVSPERLGTEFFRIRIRLLNVTLLVVDEAHCISQWGYDFRPSYLKIADLRDVLPENIPVLALTATATPEVVDDIQEKLHFKEKNVFRKSFERKNLTYLVRHTEDKMGYLLKIFTHISGTGIVYVRSRRRTKEISDFLCQNGIAADYFHAGLPNEEKDAKQAAWKKGECRVIVATNAFGMGIDKADVRVVVHTDLPDSLEAYFQEAGRAGRDELRAYAVLLFADMDAAKLKRRIADNFPKTDFVKQVYQNLANYLTLAVGGGCEAAFPFDIADFCKVWHYSINQTFHALKILEYAGYIELTDEIDNPSKLMFSVSREELYSFRIQNRRLDTLIEVVLRSYTGLFASPVHINETIIAQHLKTTRQQVYDDLVMLSKMHIVNYIPLKKMPLLIYTQSRVDNDSLVIPKSAYHDRKARYEKRINAIIEYASTSEVCLHELLLHYFGESHTHPCGQCSVCLSKRKRRLSPENFKQIETQIMQMLAIAPATVAGLSQQINADEEHVATAVRMLIDNGYIGYNSQMKLERLKT